ncbi:phage DNA packaging protein J [Actinomadura sp. NPDC048955]|uniref:phage DNA packaging protein J n=1 Tax=Actinomadura sp. NPDC048955 TaxID=3158228 RepID=UPI0033E9D85B
MSAITRSGRHPGRPEPARGTVIADRTCGKAVQSLARPGVTTIDSGRPRPTTVS